jgi:predicted nucleic-acid-binding protein
MKSFYKIKKKRIVEMLDVTVHHPNIELEEREECILTLKLLGTSSLDFADCYLLAKNTKKKYSGILSFDKKLLDSLKNK